MKSLPVMMLVLVLPWVGCSTPTMPRGESPLDGSFELRVIPEKSEAEPGDLISFHVEIENTDSSAIWIPPRNAVFPQWELVTNGGRTTGSSSHSNSSGIAYLKLKPGRTHRYFMGIESPHHEGELRLSCSIDGRIFGTVKLARPAPDAVIKP
ncbi:MAG: hypothetical protein SynsKO_19370 [Synoicihabitans sp.]